MRRWIDAPGLTLDVPLLPDGFYWNVRLVPFVPGDYYYVEIRQKFVVGSRSYVKGHVHGYNLKEQSFMRACGVVLYEDFVKRQAK